MLQETNAVKDDIRTAHRRRRAGLTPAQLEAAGLALATHGEAWAGSVTQGRPGIACVYLGVGQEPPTLPLINALHHSGHQVLLPVCERSEPSFGNSWRRQRLQLQRRWRQLLRS